MPRIPSPFAAPKKKPIVKTKVSEATINKIKSLGMTAALKKAPTASVEMREGLVRMYGAARVKKASTSSVPRNAPKISSTTPKATKPKPKKVAPRNAMRP